MEFYLNKLKKHGTTIILSIILVFTVIWGNTKHHQVQSLEHQMSVAMDRIYRSNAVFVFHAFDHVIEQPNDENLTLLFWAINDQESKLRAYITLYLSPDEIKNLLNGKDLFSYPLIGNILSIREGLNENEVEIIKKMKDDWDSFYSNLGGGLVRDGRFILGEYVKLSKRMQKHYEKLK